MAITVDNPNAAVVAGNGLGPSTYIVSLDDVTSTDAAGVIAEATAGDANDNTFTVAGVEGVATGDHIALQGSAAPSLTDATLVATFDQNPA